MFSKFKNARVFPIWMRLKSIDLRLEFGHWEADLIIGKKENGYANLLTLVERTTMLVFIKKVFSKNHIKINSIIYRLIKENNLNVKTITIDNGIEFEKIGILGSWINGKIYFC
ncbi:IS30 family transposase [Ureaplasma urealyticum]|uniref:IS30 family transposase n=1 Tax=Ureaplasma urealyticum TaxID=2130 RepID=UPI0001793BB9|nr:IS30 family transposase [Ureaplasma urealyticum]QDI63726.1 IS30 family transposase [Ureaplasma urealyticum]